APLVAALAAAAALVVYVRAPGGTRTKGGGIDFTLVREDGERIDGDAGVYRDGDRFMTLVTCPPDGDVSFELVVVDDAGTTSPLSPVPRFACGNEVPLPGALRLTGHGEETVCLIWRDGAETGRSCKTLRSAASP